MGVDQGNRASRRAAKKQKPNWKCCSKNSAADTGRYSKGLHTHARVEREEDHGTGHKFQRDDSTTKAVLKRMKALGKYEGQ